MGQIVGDVPSSPKDDDQHNDDGDGYDNPTVSSKTRDSLKEPHYARSKPSTETIVKRKPSYSSRNVPSTEGAASRRAGFCHAHLLLRDVRPAQNPAGSL